MAKQGQDQSFRPIIGIDLGTTNTAAAYVQKGHPKMMEMADDQYMIPSVVLKESNGKIVVGDEARSALVAMPARTIASIKRNMGEDVDISLGKEMYTPEEISAFILKEIKRVADEQLGEGEKEAVITVPAYFTDQQRQATKKAGELAGFVVERIINEPTAAALAYGAQNLEDDNSVLVYDLGGGTFDVSIVEMMSGILEVKASAGNHQLGGEDFDWLIVDWLAEKVKKEHQVDPREDVRAKARLKEEAERLKIELSSKESVEVSIPVVTVKADMPVGLDTVLTRAQFEEMIKPLLAETKEKMNQVLNDAGMKVDAINDALLVGGSTKTPYVQQLVRDFLGQDPRRAVDPDEAVAQGAAVQAGIKAGSLGSGLIVTDVAPFSMGIAVLDERRGREKPGAFKAIIPRNTTIPVTRTEQFTTSFNFQTTVSIEIYQGEERWVRDNYFLNDFLLEGLPPNVAGAEGVGVTFRYNLNGILEVTAKSITTGKEMTITVEDALDRNSDTAFQDSLAKVESAYGSDEDVDDIFDEEEEGGASSDLSKEAGQYKSQLVEELGNREGDVKKEIEQTIAELETALSKEDSTLLHDAIERAIDLSVDLEL
ncbi:Hsp70 family protein [Salicibibacter cibarius]|uniref:Chaperone protein DnaK n=1 Tax=Salicibibacter cibarius TaxID=2743000 RepID=A0A7T6Z0Y4_9BACI|nr:Hsp70 family protein [Salicibibacter cibarius]QQK74953.1 Hsp70 family protein [Salicibibacter cibarius]